MEALDTLGISEELDVRLYALYIYCISLAY